MLPMEGEETRMGVEHEPSRDARREEKELVERMLAGDEAAMNLFADGYFPGLYRFALARLSGDTELTREIVQTTLCKALTKLKTFRGEAPLFTWLCACCRNEIAMHFRRKKRFFVQLEPDESTGALADAPNPHSGGSPERDLIRKEADNLVHVALDLLPPHYARALEWKYLDHLSVREIAGRLRMGPKAAESLLTRARRAFRQDYERLTLSPEPRTLATSWGGKGMPQP